MVSIANGTALCMLAVGNCFPRVETDLASFRDPEYASTSFSSVLAEARVDDWRLKHELESSVSRAMGTRGLAISTASSLFPPTRSYSAEEVNDIVARSGAGDHLQIHFVQTDASLRATPSVTVHRKSGHAEETDDEITYEERSTTSTSPPGVSSAP